MRCRLCDYIMSSREIPSHRDDNNKLEICNASMWTPASRIDRSLAVKLQRKLLKVTILAIPMKIMHMNNRVTIQDPTFQNSS